MKPRQKAHPEAHPHADSNQFQVTPVNSNFPRVCFSVPKCAFRVLCFLTVRLPANCPPKWTARPPSIPDRLRKVTAAAVVFLSLAGCDGRTPQDEKVKSRSELNRHSGLLTVEHDGHRFVIYSTLNGAGVTHHPDCPCGEAKP